MKLKAFTLVELMVVMAIIAFLSVAAYGGLTFALRQGRDTQRMRIADQLQTALTAYYADYARYPGCGTYNGTRFTSQGTPVTGLPAFVYCSRAFDEKTTTSFIGEEAPSGLRNYFEGEFSSGPMPETNSDSDIRYYYVKNSDNSASRFTICVGLENPRGGNIKDPTIEDPNGRLKGCYCNGSDQTTLACIGIL